MEDLSTPEQRLKYASTLSRNRARLAAKTSLSHYPQETPRLKVTSILLRPPSPPPASTLLKRLTGSKKTDASTEPLDAYNRHFQEGMGRPQSKGGDVFPFKNEALASKPLPLLSGSASAKRERIGAIDEIRSLRLNFNEASTMKVRDCE